MLNEVATFGQRLPMWTGVDFANNTWRAVRGLVAGRNIYADWTWIQGIGKVGPVAEHVPATLVWEAPFAALPLRAGLLAFTFASIIAIWVGVFILTQPRSPEMSTLTACCGAFAILAGGGPWTLLLGQPTGFILLGLALLVHARKPWVAAVGLMLAASTFQVGLPLALSLVVLGAWPTVWRGAVLVLTCSLPPVALGIANAGLGGFVHAFFSGAAYFLGPTSHRIDLGALLHRAGVHSTAFQVAVGISILALLLLFLAGMPTYRRRLDYPPVLCLVIAVALLCTYHEPYDMLLVGGAVVPAALSGTRSLSMLPIFGLAGISAGISGNNPIAVIVDPLCLAAITVLSALAARRDAAAHAEDSPCPISSEASVAVADGPVS